MPAKLSKVVWVVLMKKLNSKAYKGIARLGLRNMISTRKQAEQKMKYKLFHYNQNNEH